MSKLVFSKVMNNVDAEFIRSTLKNQGNTNATIALLQRMQCRVSPKKWYYEFLDALLSTGFEMIVGKLEPDFLTNPSAFMPELGTYTVYTVLNEDEIEMCIDENCLQLTWHKTRLSFKYAILSVVRPKSYILLVNILKAIINWILMKLYQRVILNKISIEFKIGSFRVKH